MPTSAGTFLSSSGLAIAWERTAPRSSGAPGIFWLGGLKSDISSTKALALQAFAEEKGCGLVRFDYSGHGRSEGKFEDQTVSDWLDQAIKAWRTLTHDGPHVLVGSSLGGWLALLLVRALMATGEKEAIKVRGLVLLAPAVDMTEVLMWDVFSQDIRDEIMRKGGYPLPSAYGEPYWISKHLIEDGRRHLLLSSPISVPCPVHILHGDEDHDVPWAHGMRIYNAVQGEDIRFTLIKGGDHRLSSPKGLAILLSSVRCQLEM